MRRFQIATLAPTCSFLIWFASAAEAQLLRVYYTTDPTVASERPPGDPGMEWDEVDDAANELTTTLQPGDRIWFAVNNDEDFARTKWVALEIGGDPAHVNLSLDSTQTKGFQTDDDSTPVNTALVAFGLGPLSNQWKWRMTPQPLWERFAFTAAFPINNATLEVKSNSVCNNLRVGFVPLDVEITDSSFGAPGAMIDEPLTTEIHVFPAEVPVDPEHPPTFDAPPETGPWVSEIVFATPDGQPRPLGGVAWRSLGAGLSVEDRFDASFRLLESRDYDYEFYSLAPGSDGTLEYRSYWLALEAGVPVPTAGQWTMMSMVALMLLTGLTVLVRRRAGAD